MAKSDLESTAWAPQRDSGVEATQSRFSETLREYGIYVVLALLVLGFSIVAPGFASITNFILILLQVSVMGILSIGMLFVILSRGIDLSVGSILAVSGMFAGLLARQDFTLVN